MKQQLKFFSDASNFEESAPTVLEGFRYQPNLIEPADEDRLIEHVRELPFKEFEFHGYLGKRRVVSFGWQYEFSGSGRLRKADDVPEFLLRLRMRAAAFAQMEPEALQHVLVIEYGPGAGIGWHRDKPVFGEVVGVSLVAPCLLRFRRKMDSKSKGRNKWQRVNVLAEPRSAYHLSGPARLVWEHSILRVDSLRYSVTFRNVLEESLKA